jgi:hypothetical protein
MFLAHIYKIDLANKTVGISWLIVGCGAGFQLAGSDVYYSTYCGELAIPIDVFVDGFVASFLLILSQS